MKTILVGIDGSEHADRALEFAAEEAALRGAALRIVCAWQMPMMIDPMAAFSADWLANLRQDAEKMVAKAVEKASGLHPLESCEGKVVEGHPASVLLQEAENADILVMGSHGRGGFASLLLGSVAAQVIHHARCPVVVVRSQADA